MQLGSTWDGKQSTSASSPSEPHSTCPHQAVIFPSHFLLPNLFSPHIPFLFPQSLSNSGQEGTLCQAQAVVPRIQGCKFSPCLEPQGAQNPIRKAGISHYKCQCILLWLSIPSLGESPAQFSSSFGSFHSWQPGISHCIPNSYWSFGKGILTGLPKPTLVSSNPLPIEQLELLLYCQKMHQCKLMWMHTCICVHMYRWMVGERKVWSVLWLSLWSLLMTELIQQLWGSREREAYLGEGRVCDGTCRGGRQGFWVTTHQTGNSLDGGQEMKAMEMLRGWGERGMDLRALQASPLLPEQRHGDNYGWPRNLGERWHRPEKGTVIASSQADEQRLGDITIFRAQLSRHSLPLRAYKHNRCDYILPHHKMKTPSSLEISRDFSESRVMNYSNPKFKNLKISSNKLHLLGVIFLFVY